MRMKVLIVSRDFRLLSWGSSVLRGAHEVHVLDVLEADGAVPAHPFDVCVVDAAGRLSDNAEAEAKGYVYL